MKARGDDAYGVIAVADTSKGIMPQQVPLCSSVFIGPTHIPKCVRR